MIPTTEAIAKEDLGRTILQQQLEIRNFIERHDAFNMSLRRFDDPFESPEDSFGCFFGVKGWPIDHDHLTCGMVANLLQGLWEYLYREERFHGVIFEVIDDVWGAVGVGKISLTRVLGSWMSQRLGVGNVTDA